MQTFKNLVLLMLFCFSLSYCSHYSNPHNIPPVGIDVVGPYDQKLSVDLINNQDDKRQYLYWSMGIHRYYANYNEWTQFFIDRYTDELKKRGVTVSKDSPNKIKIKLSDFALMQGMFVIRVNAKFKFEKTDENWVKEWVDTDTSGWSGGRAFGSVLYSVIKKVLTDPEIIGKMKVK